MSEATIDSMMGALQRLKDVRIWLTIFGQRERGLIMPYANQRLAERRGQQQLEEIQVGSQQANSTPAALREESPSPRHRVWINLSYASYKPLFYPSSLIHVQSDFNNHNHFSCIVTHPEVRCFGTLEMSCLWWTYALRFPLREVSLIQDPVSLPHSSPALFRHVVWHMKGTECQPCLAPRLQISLDGVRRHHRRTYGWNAKSRRKVPISPQRTKGSRASMVWSA